MPETLKPLDSPVSRRTLATAAAWSTPAVLASVATPSLAASPFTGVLSFDGLPFVLVSLEEKTITGTIQTTGGSQPADLILTATVTGDFTITRAPVITGPGTFSLKVKAPSGGTSGMLTVQSTNYAQYTQAQAAIESAPEGIIIQPGSSMISALVPLAKTWSYSGSSDGVRYYDLAAGMTINPSTTTYLHDLRMSFYEGPNTSPIPSNLNQNPWIATPSNLYGSPNDWAGNNAVQITTRFLQLSSPSRGDLMNNQAAQADAIKTTVGGMVWSGVGTVTASATMPGSLWIPSRDNAGLSVAAQARGFYLTVPKKPAAGQGGNGMTVRTVTLVQITNSRGQTVTTGFRFAYAWSGITN